MPERNRVQALLPEGAGAAPEPGRHRAGVWMKVGTRSSPRLPGVPYEMKIMFDEQVLPRLRRLGLVTAASSSTARSTCSARASRISRPMRWT